VACVCVCGGETIGNEFNRKGISRVINEVKSTQFAGCISVGDDVVEFPESSAPFKVCSLESVDDLSSGEFLNAVTPYYGLEDIS
jgi:hypothetical protein